METGESLRQGCVGTDAETATGVQELDEIMKLLKAHKKR
jgi:hypothetical protein